MHVLEAFTGLRGVVAREYSPPHHESRLILESSATENYTRFDSNPRGHFLWVGDKHFLDRSEVETLVGYLQHWLDTQRLPAPEPPVPSTTDNHGYPT